MEGISHNESMLMYYVFKLVDTVAGGAGVPVTAVGLLASGNWYPGGTKILKY